MKVVLDAVQRERLVRLVAVVSRIVVGAVGSVVVHGVVLFVYGPLSDGSVQQIVAGSKIAGAASLVIAAPRHWIADAARRRTRHEADDAARQSRMDAAVQGLADHD